MEIQGMGEGLYVAKSPTDQATALDVLSVILQIPVFDICRILAGVAFDELENGKKGLVGNPENGAPAHGCLVSFVFSEAGRSSFTRRVNLRSGHNRPSLTRSTCRIGRNRGGSLLHRGDALKQRFDVAMACEKVYGGGNERIWGAERLE